MQDSDIERFKAALLQQREELVALRQSSSESRAPVELDQTTQGRLSRMDAMQQQAMAVEADRRRDLQIQRIDAALKRIESGDFGYCIKCDEEIAAKRLEIDPATAACIACTQ